MKKRGQITIFVFVGIIIVVIAIFLLMINSGKREITLNEETLKKGEFGAEYQETAKAIYRCVESTSDNALIIIGLQGGYLYPEKYEDRDLYFLSYHYYEGRSYTPNKTVVESELADYVSSYLGYCFEKLKRNGLNIEYGEIRTLSKLQSERVIFNIRSNVVVRKEQDSKKISEFSIERNSSLNEIVELGEFIGKENERDPARICINCIDDKAEKLGVYATVLPYSNTTTLFILSDTSNVPEGYRFMFLEKYAKG